MPRLSELGEKEVVRRLLESISSDVPVGPGDDAAALDLGEDLLVVSTDLVGRTTHVPVGMTDYQMGWMAAAVNFSDIAAMGARPLGLVLAMAMPRDTEFGSVKSMISGAQDCCLSFDSYLVGGDTKEGDELMICGTAFGRVGRDSILLRSGASPGDLLAVTGDLGLAAAGYFSLERGIDFEEGRRALFQPTPRVREGMILSATGGVTSCMDISDGLASSVHQLSASSDVGFKLDYRSLPVHPLTRHMALRMGKPLEEMILYYGGDYELLFTIRPDRVEKVISSTQGKVSVIGRAEGKENLLDVEGEIVSLENKGYEHFR